MAVTPMKKIQIIGHQDHREKIINLLHRTGRVQIISSSSQELPKEDIGVWEKKLSELSFAIDFLHNYEENSRGLLGGMFSSRIIISEHQWEKAQDEFVGSQIINQCQEISSQLNEIRNLGNRLKSRYDFLSPWQNLSLPLENLVPTRKIRLQVGTFTVREGEDFYREIQPKNLPLHIEEVFRTASTLYVVIIYLSQVEEIFLLLRRHHFSPVDFAGFKGIVSSLLKEISEEMGQLQEKEKQLYQKAKKLARYRQQLLMEYDYCLTQKQKKEVLIKLLYTRKAFVIEGWIRAKDIDFLRKQLEDLTPQVGVWIRDPGDEEVPVEIENSAFFRPFELITRLYGMPHPRELDPTPFLALFFALFFGICLSDAGYGIILSLVGYYLVRQTRRQGKESLFGWLFVITGLMTIVMGAFMGGWFGDLFQYLPWEALRQVRARVMLFDPLENLILFLVIALSLGWLQILAGLGIKAFQNIRQGKILDAWVDQIAWIIILVAVVVFVLVRMKLIPALGQGLALAGGMVGALSILGFGGRESRSIIGRIVMGAYRLYGITGFFSDILSYTRLLALGLATGIIALVINLMGGFFRDIPYVGLILWILVLTVGHIFNLIINTLGAFVHSCRLQYVEFFTKFFEGGGKIFQPFQEERKYTLVFLTKKMR